ncbi:hypothetical protein KJ708_06220, partial [bacterium]|nr:hypothetical protein [bacterium]MBU1918652.1 hypothetical protein [bacterium]
MKKINILITLLLTSMLVLSPLANVQAATVSSGTGGGPSFLHTGSGGSSASGQSVQADLFSGAATYSVKLPVAPATGGVQPNLILNYNSQRKNPNSVVGYGWDLELGSIQRKPETNGIVDFEEGTSFEVRFAGQSESLVLVDSNVTASDYGLSVSAGTMVDFYQAQVESSFNVYLHMYETTNGSYSNGRNDLGWIVIDKKG